MEMLELSLKLEYSIWFEENIVSHLCNLDGVKNVLIDVNKSDKSFCLCFGTKTA